MSNDLRDQLLKAGLVSEDQVKAAETRPQRAPGAARKPIGKKPKKPRPSQGAKGAAARPKRPRKPAAPAQTPSPTPHLDKAQREVVRTFLREKRQNTPDAPLPYNFQDGNAVKKLWVTADQQAALGSGELVIISRNDRHYLIGREDSEHLLTLDPKAVVIRADDARGEEEEDPAYKEHPIPDDLVW
ncbi:MAG: DUF2058 family protein [Acidihalobacter sp.]